MCQRGRWGVNFPFPLVVHPHSWPDLLRCLLTVVRSKSPWSLGAGRSHSWVWPVSFQRRQPLSLSLLSFCPLQGEPVVQFTATDLDLKRKHFSLQRIAPGRCKVRPTSKQIPPLRGKQDFPGNPHELMAPWVTCKHHGWLSRHGEMCPQKWQQLLVLLQNFCLH